jgi:DNA-directed RNA polymerase specialized sigma24 family protein
MLALQLNAPYLQSALAAAHAHSKRMAVRHGLSDEDRDDMRQEALLELLEAADKFDPQRASTNTFTGVVAKNRSLEVLDAMVKQRIRSVSLDAPAANEEQMGDQCGGRFEDWVDAANDELFDLFDDASALHDLEVALALMSDEQLELYELLQAHMDVPDAARASDLSSATFYRRLGELRMHLRMFGFRVAA